MTTVITRKACIISFRARTDIDGDWTLNCLYARISEFGGTLLGVTGDDFDMVAAFNSEYGASIFLSHYFEGEVNGPIGTYVIGDATI